MTSMTPQESHDFADLDPAEQASYRQYRRRMSHDDALQSARDSIAERAWRAADRADRADRP